MRFFEALLAVDGRGRADGALQLDDLAVGLSPTSSTSHSPATWPSWTWSEATEVR